MTISKAPHVGISVRARSRLPSFVLTDEVREAIRRRSLLIHARQRVADAMRELALDICGDDGSLSASDRAWLRQAVAEPASEATEEALRVLTQELARVLHGAPPGVRPGVIASSEVTRTDFE